MKSSSSRRSAIFLLPLATVLLATAVGAARPPQYQVTILPPIPFGDGELEVVVGRVLNNNGQIAGEARSRSQSVAFRFSPDGSIITMDPFGEGLALARHINDGGDVAGWAIENGRFRGFLYSDEGGLVPLLDGLPSTDSFFLHGLDERGRIIGVQRNRSFLYSAEEGWTELKALDPRLKGSLVSNIGDGGHLVFKKSLGTDGPERPEGGFLNRILHLVYTPDGELLEFGRTGPVVFNSERPNRAGAITFFMYTEERTFETGVWTQEGGLRRLKVPRAREAFPDRVTDGGEVSGLARQSNKRRLDTFFIAPIDGRGTTRTVRPKRFRRLVRKEGLTGRTVRVVPRPSMGAMKKVSSRRLLL